MEKNIQQAHVIFEGKVISRESVEDESNGICWKYSWWNSDRRNCGGKMATIEVSKIWKGEVGSTAKVWAEDGCYCLGHSLSKGSNYIIFATLNKRDTLPKEIEFIADNFCGGTAPLDNDAGKKKHDDFTKILPQ